MSNPRDETGTVHELASLYALGGLGPAEEKHFEEHLRMGCEACSAELRSLEDVTSALAASIAVEPPSQLRERLMARVTRMPRTPGIAYHEAGVLIARSKEIDWKPFAPGITFKPLYRDKARNTDTMLVRMEAGSRIPRHRHAQIEELFVLSGDLHVEDQVMFAGDYCRADLDSVHDQSFSETGCVFLLMASPDNQLLA